jgi:hypothetical protein
MRSEEEDQGTPQQRYSQRIGRTKDGVRPPRFRKVMLRAVDLEDARALRLGIQGRQGAIDLVLHADSDLESNCLDDEIQESADFGRRKILGRV